MFRLKINFTSDVPDVHFLVNNRGDTLATNRTSAEIYANIKVLSRSESFILDYISKIYSKADSHSVALGTILLDFQNNFIKLIQFSDEGVTSTNAQYLQCAKDSAIALQAIQIFLEKIASKKIDPSEFSEKSYMLMKRVKSDVKYFFYGYIEPTSNLMVDFIHRLNQGIISLGEQVNIDFINLKPTQSRTDGPRSPDACLLQLIILMQEADLNHAGLLREASDIFKSGIVSADAVNSTVDKLLDHLSINLDKNKTKLHSYICKIKSGLNFISHKKNALSLAHGGAENISKHRELDVANNAVLFDAMFTRLYESSLAFQLDKLLQCSSKFKEEVLNPLISAMRTIIRNAVITLEDQSTSPDILKNIQMIITYAVMKFNRCQELGDVKNVASPEMKKHYGIRDCRDLDPLIFLKAELECINEIEAQRDRGDVDMVGLMNHVSLAVRFVNLAGQVESIIPSSNDFFRKHITPSKQSRAMPEDSFVGGRIIRTYPTANFFTYSQPNFKANHFGLMSAGHINFYPNEFNKNPEKPNFRTHTSFSVKTKIDPYANDDIRISEENQFILDKGFLLASGVSGTVWGNISILSDINQYILNSDLMEPLPKVNEKLFTLHNIVSMIQLGGHSFYEGLWPVQEAIAQNIMLEDDMSAKTILSNDAVKTENGLNMSIIARDQMLRFLMSDIEEGAAMCSNAEDEAFEFVKAEFKKHDKYYQKH